MSFSRQMRQWANNTGEDVDKLVRAVNLDLVRQVTKKTPVGNPSLWKSKPPKGYTGGQAKGNWFATNGNPSSQIDNSVRAKNSSKPVNRAMSAINASAGQVFYIVNNLPYIRRLEYEGWSGQAPQGMVRVTVSEFNRRLERAARTIRR